ncbi:hypothetical protein BCR36DRAFT_582846 [Piromyces finnis]|uniref:HAP1 N-terminal domain-containing protein n=1 Tax=Piromyces finnis TaxID=1754191 RepID=A0A1Y1VC20_9FUNG|nr:hypothetical protein BCR36DRAFT_582846 [Piromyces finnis]|eukprot:ORX51806.1 hypothetical protein BCR36DRAFT_582846 [Piromyces finnis]
MTSSGKDLNDSSDSLKSLDENERKIYSKNDLNNHLNDIKNVLRDKERDLSLAAEIGQQLLEANTVLKKAYEELYIQNQDTQRQLQRYEHMPVIHSGRSSPVLSNSSPLSPRYTAMRSRNNSPTPPRSRKGSRNLSLPPSVRLDGTSHSSSPPSIARSTEGSESENEEANNIIKEQFLEKIKYLENSINSLERHNEELKVLLEKKKNEVKDIQIQNSKLLLIKDGEVYDLKKDLESLMNKTKKLEMEKRTLTKENQRQANELDRIESIDQEYIQDLLVKINRLDSSLRRMEITKEELEKNIENIMMEKIEYQDKCKSLDKKLEDFLYYKHLHDTQAQHIQELNQTIEQQRMQIQNLDFQLYNLAMISDTTKSEIKFSEKYTLENPRSMKSIQSSTGSLGSKLSSHASSDVNMNNYDSDTIVITARRNINNSNRNSQSIPSIRSSQSIPESHDSFLTLSSYDLGKKTLYSELENTGWYDETTDTLKDDHFGEENRLIQSYSDSDLNKLGNMSFTADEQQENLGYTIHALPLQRTRQPYHHQYHSSYSLDHRKLSDASNYEGLTLVDKANQSFGNNNIENIIKPKIKNDVNSYELLINTIENEFKNSEEEIKTDDPKDSSNTSKSNDAKGKKEKSRKKDHDDNMDSTLSNDEDNDDDENDDSTKILPSEKNIIPNDIMIDDTNNETTDQSNRQQTHYQTYSRQKYNYQSISNTKTLALIKHSNIPLFDFKKLSHMIESDQNLNSTPLQNNVPVIKSAEEISQKPKHAMFQQISFESIFKAFQFSKFKSTHLLTDANYSKIDKKSGKKATSTFSLTGLNANGFNGDSEFSKSDSGDMSILESVVRLSSPPSSGTVIQEISDKDVELLNSSGAQTISNMNASTKEGGQYNNSSSSNHFFIPKPTSLSHSIIPVGTASNKEFNHLIKNFHSSSPITPLVANINLNNAIRGRSRTKEKKISSKSEPVISEHEHQKSSFSLKHRSLFGNTKRIQTPKMDISLMYKENKNDTPTRENSPQTSNSPSGSLFHMIKDKSNQNGDVRQEENDGTSSHYNTIFTNTMNNSSILSSNTIMNNQVILDQYRNTLNHYSNSGSAILQVLVDSWLRFLNGFVGYGSDINYDINNLEINGINSQNSFGNSSRFYAAGSHSSDFTEDSFSATNPSTPASSSSPSSTSQLTKKI